MRVVEVRPRAEPRQQPVEGLLQRPAPARGVEGLDPHPRTVVVVRDRRVELGVAVVVGAGRAEPPVRAHVVAVDLARRRPARPRARRSAGRPRTAGRAARATRAAAGRTTAPRARRARGGSRRGTARRRSPRSSHSAREVRERVVARLGDEALVEVRRPRRHVRQLVLERARDHRAEQVADPLLEAAVHHREQPPAGGRREVVEAALDDVEEHQPPGAAEARDVPVERHPHELAVARQRGRRDRDRRRPGTRPSARRRPRRPRARASGPHARGGAARPGPGSSRPRSRSGRRTTRARRAPPRRGTRPRTAPTTAPT